MNILQKSRPLRSKHMIRANFYTGNNHSLHCRSRREFLAFQELLRMVPHLEDRLVEGTDEEAVAIADLVRVSCIQTLLIDLNVMISDPEGRLQRKVR